MTEILSVLNPDHFERSGELYQIVDAIVSGATLGGTSRQLAQGNDYPIEKYTPGSPLGAAPLTNANFAQSLRNAIAAAQAVKGGNVIIPRGEWRPSDSGTEEILVLGAGRDKNVTIRGAGGMDGTILTYPTGYTGTAFKFQGSPPAPDLYWNGGMRDLTIVCETEDVSNTGIGLHIESCINTQFRNITIRNFTGGTSFKATYALPDYTNQYVQLWNFTAAGGDINYDLDGFINCQGYGVYSTAARTRDWLCRNAKVAVFGGNFQSSCDVCFETAGDGGNQVALYGFYFEGSPNTVFKMSPPAVTSSRLEVYGFQLGAAVPLLFDVSEFNNCNAHYVNRVGVATVILKARNNPSVFLVDCGDPVLTPEKFDIDDASKARFVCLGGVAVATAIQAFLRVGADLGITLPGFATGAEPGDAVTGDLVRDTSYDRPSFKASSGGFKRLAYDLDDNALTALLTPYAADIFDPAVARGRTLVSSDLDALIGLLHGSSIAAPTSGQRPAWNASDPYFGGRPSFSCAVSGNLLLKGTLASTIASGSRPALFVVYRATTADDGSNRRLAIAAEHGADHTSALSIGQSDLNQSNHAYGLNVGSLGLAWAIGAAGTDVYGHVSYAYSAANGLFSLARDAESVVTGDNPGNSTSVLDTLLLGGAWNSSAYVGCDVTIAYAAMLSAPLDAATQMKALRAALSLYCLR